MLRIGEIMSDVKYPVITISREFGAGGRSVAKILSELLDIPWYDKDFIKITALKSGYSEEEILKEGEELSALEALVDSILNNSASYVSSHDSIFEAQKDSIIELAKSPCIIVGRCANLILAEAGIPSFDIFLFADLEYRLSRSDELGFNKVEDPKKYVKRHDTLRERYCKAYMKKDYTDSDLYNICLDTGTIGIEKSAQFLADLIKSL